MNRTIQVALVMFGAAVLVATLGAQTRTTAEGIYTAAQATRGEKVYTDNCVMCHGADLKGNDVTPALNGAEFDGYWRGKSLGELFEKITITMPKSAPGSLTPEQSADVIAFILSKLPSKPGTRELVGKMEEMDKITIEAAK